MTRTKVNLQYIAKDAERKSTFKRRKKGLMKMAEELSILCAVDACAIIFCPYDPEPDAWPSQLEAQRITAKRRNMSPLEQSRRMIDQKDFLSQQLTRVNEQVAKQHREVQHKEMANIMFECLNGKGFEYLNMFDLNHLNSLLSQNIRAIERRISNFLNKSIMVVSKMGSGGGEARVLGVLVSFISILVSHMFNVVGS